MGKVNYSRFITALSKARKPSPLREASEIILASPGMKSLCVGLPNAATFPITSFYLNGKNGKQIPFVDKDMESSFQYTVTQGYPEMLKYVEKFSRKYHKPPLLLDDGNVGWDSIITTGCEDGLCKIVDMLVTPGDSVLVQNPAYPGVTSKLQVLTKKLIPVESDNEGVIPQSLKDCLSNWSPSDVGNPNSDIPKMLYTVPNASNPTGSTASGKRKREIYEMAQKYDLIIVEDDAYYFLQFDGATNPSYQELDCDGRVLRLDTMSKVLGGGLRLGWVSGAKPFIERILLHQQVSTLQASSLSQMIAIKLFEDWGEDGFENHLLHIRSIYKEQRNKLITCLERHLSGLATWNVPDGGMFLWIKVLGLEDTTDLVYKRARRKNILVMPGSIFELLPNVESPYLRVSYSFENLETMDEIIMKLAECIHEELSEKSTKL